jgi:hypothetical protein
VAEAHVTGPQLPPKAGWRLTVRTGLAWALAALGAVALFLGWWGVSGTPLPGKQIPYLVSGGLTGVGLLVLAAALFASEDIRSQLTALKDVERRVEELYLLLTEEPEAAPAQRVAIPAGTSYHRGSCRLVAGKPRAQQVSEEQVRSRALKACRLCDPELV